MVQKLFTPKLELQCILHDHIAANKEEFRKYVSGEIEARLAKLTEIGRWGTHVELKAAAGIMRLPTYVFTPTLKVDKQYAWNKIVPCSTYVNSPSPDTDVVCDHLKNLCISHIELSHTKGIRVITLRGLPRRKTGIQMNCTGDTTLVTSDCSSHSFGAYLEENCQ